MESAPGAALDGALARLARAVPLSRFEVAPALLECEGSLGGKPVTMRTRAHASRALWLSRFTLLEGPSLCIASVVCFPRPDYPLPIFGADWVSARSDRVMLAVDASPVLPAEDGLVGHSSLFEQARARHHKLEPAGELPAFCRELFSPHHVFVHVPPSRSGELFDVFDDFFSCWLSVLASVAPRSATADLVGARVAAYARAHREDDRFLGLLGRAFGGELAARLVRDLLFPDLTTDDRLQRDGDPDRRPR